VTDSPYRDAAPRDELLYEEVQRFRQPWLWLLLAGVIAAEALALRSAWNVLVGVASGLLLVGVLMLLAAAALTVRVRPGWIEVRFWPFHLRPRHFALAGIESFDACSFSPIRDYGGWGLRGFGSDRCYTVSGSRGVRLRFRDGRMLMIGSQRAEELADAMHRAAH
jgi:hypothetical protein